MVKKSAPEIYLTPISDGTVLDHLPKGTALKLLKLLNLELHDDAITIAMNVPSKKVGRKDLIFIEGKHLTEKEIEKIALIARNATLNLIKNSKVSSKKTIELSGQCIGTIKCFNPNCITNFEEIETRFSIKKTPLKAQCFYCEKEMNEKEIGQNIK